VSAAGSRRCPKPGEEFARVQLQEGVGVIGERWLRFRAVALRGGSTGLRIDAQVLWLLPRDPIPRGARLLRVDERSTRPDHPRLVVFNVRSIRRIAPVTSLLNSLPIERPSLAVRLYPPPRGSIRLAFYRRSSEPPLALVTDSLRGCDGAQVVIRGRPQQPALAIDLSLSARTRARSKDQATALRGPRGGPWLIVPPRGPVAPRD
jgi:hypothetical protein